MAWAGIIVTRTNGTYSGSAVWQSDAAAAIKIRADRHDTHDQDLAQGINNCLTKDGQNSPTTNVSWGGFKITSLAAGVAAGDAVNKGQLDGLLTSPAVAPTLTLNATNNVTAKLYSDAAAELVFDVYDFTTPATKYDLYLCKYGGTVRAGHYSTEGAAAGYTFINRSGAEAWQWYATSNIARLFNGTTDVVEVATDGTLTTDGRLKSAAHFNATGAAAILSAETGSISLRPNGADVTTNQATIGIDGALTLNAGRKLSKVTLSTSAPGVLADGELFLRY